MRLEELYPGIDVIFHGGTGPLEYDAVVKPGADPRQVRMELDGTQRVVIDPDGNLQLVDQAILFHRPAVFEAGDGGRIAARYVRTGVSTVGFALARYDRAQGVVIDPAITFSTFLGGSGVDATEGVGFDAMGNVYVASRTTSTNFPLVSPEQATFKGLCVAVTKLDPTGTALVYSTYVGGSGGDRPFGMTVDGPGNAYVAGYTSSTDFPATAGAAQPTYGGGPDDAFVFKLNVAGSALVYATYLGGSGDEGVNGGDQGNPIAVDTSGNAYFGGTTNSADFPVTAGALQTRYADGGADAFVTKLNPTGTARVYSTLLGGSGADNGNSVAVDGAGNAWVVGTTTSTNFPLKNPYRGALSPGRDAYVAKLDPSGSSLLFSTYFGGNGEDVAHCAAVDSSGDLYVAGYTTSTDLPVMRPTQASTGGSWDVWTARFKNTGALSFSTYLGGSGDEGAHGVAVDAAGHIWLTGNLGSLDFPLVEPLQSSQGGLLPDGGVPDSGVQGDLFITELDSVTPRLKFSTYFGGAGADWGEAIALDGRGGVGLAGRAWGGFPSQSALQPVWAGLADGLVLKLRVAPTVSACLPDAGLTDGGTGVSIWGSNFGPGTTVSFGGVPLQNMTRVSATQLTASTPTHAVGPVDITVTNEEGFSATMSGGFNYFAPVGASCSSGSQCSTGVCADSVCCATACAGGCGACNVDAGAAVNGTCTFFSTQTVCRPDAGHCDLAATCTGNSSVCPANPLLPQCTEQLTVGCGCSSTAGLHLLVLAAVVWTGLRPRTRPRSRTQPDSVER
jgi:hypothetical protein